MNICKFKDFVKIVKLMCAINEKIKKDLKGYNLPYENKGRVLILFINKE